MTGLRTPADPATEYHEPARGYRSSVVIAASLVAGFVLDTALGGGRAHAVAWSLALVVVTGIDALAVHAARRLRSVTVTARALVIGDRCILRTDIVSVETARVDGGARVQLTGAVVDVRTRHPVALATALGYRPAGQASRSLPDPDPTIVRLAQPAELGGLPELEARADTVFRVCGIGPLPGPATVAEFEAAPAVLVAVGSVGGVPIGFARLAVADDGAHLESLSVLPARMRRGVGGALVEAACEWARDQGYGHITLCTFADVAWNGPFYARHGFGRLDVNEYTPRLRELRAEERAAGLDVLGSRVVMRRELR